MTFTGHWEVCPVSDEGPEEDETLEFGAPEWASRWAFDLRGDVFAMNQMRRELVAAGHTHAQGMEDDEIVRLIGREFEAGRLVFARRKRRPQTFGGASDSRPAAAQDSAPAPPPSPPPPREQAPEPPTFSPDADLLAIAAAQQEAARLGVPFCEECAKAALANQR
ncbi:MAG TPA: hypothetical protein VGF59_20900 [Bryobacteraceae bacterium]|jgi:hypothetical protein